jgi:ssDNA-binding Zn-finger/Zn-ribbon topoisomerase 1
VKRAFANLEEDEDGRKVLHMGGQCPICGAGPDMKYAANGKLVLYHIPVECAGHVNQWRARYAREKQKELA